MKESPNADRTAMTNNDSLAERVTRTLHPEYAIMDDTRYMKPSGKFDFRAFVRILRYMSRTELNKLCVASGMSEREIYAVLAYVYDNKSIAQIADELNISTGQFHYKKERLAHRFRTYLKSIGYPNFKVN